MHHGGKQNLLEVAFLSVEKGDTVADGDQLDKKNEEEEVDPNCCQGPNLPCSCCGQALD